MISLPRNLQLKNERYTCLGKRCHSIRTFQIYLICVSNNATYYVEKVNHEQFPLASSKVSNELIKRLKATTPD